MNFTYLGVVTAVDPLDLAWVGILAEHLAGATRRRHSLDARYNYLLYSLLHMMLYRTSTILRSKYHNEQQ